DRQTLLFSATMPRQIRDLSNRYMKNPVEISVSTISSTAENVKQCVMFTPQPRKTEALIALVKKHKGERVIVFTRTKRGADRIAKRLNAQNLSAAAIHGNRSQNQRMRALDAFRKGDVPVLVATDVAARGIDIPGVELVVNFDLPQVAEAYVHRIGRTGRAGKSGLAVMFCNDEEMKMLSDIERIIKKNIPVMNPDGTMKPEAEWNPTERTYDGEKPSEGGQKKPRRNRGRKKQASENTPQAYEQTHNPNTNKASGGGGEKRKPRGPKKPSASGGDGKPSGKRRNRPGSKARNRHRSNQD
ncbi:MAG: DEAD/DEAH box helicase, partial [Robiginitomaculum sp.]|nr:DEAD/DEAH box helicase [Robiginitomaculum sp.]